MGMDYSRAKDWIVAERGFEPEHLGKCESIMCQGNGYLCLRNATDEFNPREQRDLFVAGTFNKFDDNEVTELPNAADVSRLEIKLDGQRFSLLTGTVEDYDRTLDLKTGETVRKVVWKAPNGRRYELCFRRFVSMERLHVIGQKLCVRPLDGEALLDIAGGIDGRMTNSGSQHFSEGDKRLFKGRHMQYSQTTGQSKIDFVFNTTFSFAMDGEAREEPGFIVIDRRMIAQEYQITIPAGSTLCVEKLSSVYTSRDRDSDIDLLEACGYTADDIPDNYDDYKAFLTDLQAKLDEVYGKNQIAAMTYNQDLSRNLPILQDGNDGLVAEDGTATLTSDGVVANMEYILDFVKNGLWKTPSDLGLGWNGEAFGTGKAAIMEEGNWVYGTLKADYSDINFGVKEMPSYNGTQYSMSYTVGYGIYALSENKDMASAWIKYVTSVDGLTIWCGGAGCLPPRSDAAEAMDVESDPVWAVHSAMTECSLPWQLGNNASIINTAYQNYFPLAVSGEMTAAEFLAAAEQQANQEIANAG